MWKSCSAAQKRNLPGNRFRRRAAFVWPGEEQSAERLCRSGSFQNGVANLLTLISGIKDGDKLPEEIRAEDYPVRNIRVYDDDVRLLFKQIPDNFFDKVFLLFPDPWPKKKHAGRRFVNPDNLKEVYRVLKTGGLFRIATDHPVYKRHVLRTMHQDAGFIWTAKCGEDWKREPADWVRTKYQQKAVREGRRPVFFDYRKI